MTGRWVCLASILVLALPPSDTWAEDPPQFLLAWGSQGSGPGQFDRPWGVAVDGAGMVYVGDAHNFRIQVFSGTGDWIREMQADRLEPLALAVDANGNVFVTTFQNQFLKYASNGALVGLWGGIGGFGVAVDPSGNVYVADTNNHRILKLTNDGVFLAEWGTFGAGNGQLNAPTGVATDGAGYVYVADWENRRIVKFTDNGGFVANWGSDPNFYPRGVAVDAGGNLIVLETLNQRMQKFTSTGVFLTQWGLDFLGYAVAVDPTGNLFIADTVLPSSEVRPRADSNGQKHVGANQGCLSMTVHGVGHVLSASQHSSSRSLPPPPFGITPGVHIPVSCWPLRAYAGQRTSPLLTGIGALLLWGNVFRG